MAGKEYDWENGAILEDHSRRKHKILREYIFDYLLVRCSYGPRDRFRIAIVDGFAGGGRYRCGTPGSPLIFIEELKRAVEQVNVKRAAEGQKFIEVESLLVFNDASPTAINLLRDNIAPVLAEITESTPRLHLRVEYLNEFFESAYPKIKESLGQGRYTNVIFNLDQCGDSHVERNTILDIMRSYPAVEVFYTFMISALLAFLKKNEPEMLQERLKHIGVSTVDIDKLSSIMSRKDWLATAEKIVFDNFRLFAPYVSPFSINNPGGWRYWMIHFANVYRARQVYNNILHDNAGQQAHCGRHGLNMLSYDPRHDDQMLYLFDQQARDSAKQQLIGDIANLVTNVGGAMSVGNFYEVIYNDTPAHTDDIHSAIIENPDLEVLTTSGGERRKPNTIKVDDVIKRKSQMTFFPLFDRSKLQKDD
ncbi:MAG: three-Cys-motif partner protein TcmP [Thalassospira sp.]|uniref:three-Cys-motif partner protein TcmP n=1 Tax=Thalassospira sp. TaxID=1912094 RepID=UPI0032EAF97B